MKMSVSFCSLRNSFFQLLFAVGFTGVCLTSSADTTIEVLHGTVGNQGGFVHYDTDSLSVTGGGEIDIREWEDSLSQGNSLRRGFFYFVLPEIPAGETLLSATIESGLKNTSDVMGTYQVGLYHSTSLDMTFRDKDLLFENTDYDRVGTYLDNMEPGFISNPYTLDVTAAVSADYALPELNTWFMMAFEDPSVTNGPAPPAWDINGNGINEFLRFDKTLTKLTLEFVGSGNDPVSGDYNGDGTVDAADYTVWRDNLGNSGAPGSVLGDGDNGTLTGTPDGTVDGADYAYWVSRYGATSSTSSTTAVPEPSSFLLLASALLLGAKRRKG